MRKLQILIGLALLPLSSILGQGVVTINPNTQRFIGNVSAFNRDKHLGLHAVGGDADMKKFVREYNLNPAFVGSRAFWTPMNRVSNDAVPPLSSIPNKIDGVRQVRPYFVQTQNPQTILTKRGKGFDYTKPNLLPYFKALAAYTARSYRDEWPTACEFLEPFNEPFVHARDFYPESWNNEKNIIIKTRMSEFVRELAKAVNAVPELANMKVIGFANAWPDFEGNNFKNWNESQKLFMDVAGADVDGFSIHPYDNSQKGASNAPNSGGGRRSGANLEAVLDMVENYSLQKWGVVKPIAITEYGQLVDGNSYNAVVNAQAVRSQVHMAMQFMERGKDISMCIPFNTGKPAGGATNRATLFIQQNGQWKLTDRKYFYEVWKDVKGKRIDIASNNIDVQAQAFVNGTKLYVILNNLKNATQTVRLNLLNKSGLQNVNVKRIKVPLNARANMSTNTLGSAPASMGIAYGETMILTYNYSSNITFNNAVRSKRYYGNQMLKPIAANANTSFTVPGLQVGGAGKAVVRVSVGRPFKRQNPNVNRNLRPEVSVNGNKVNYSGDIIRGYEQLTRKGFFGTLEIPVPYRMLRPGNNTVGVKFPDGGGHISTVTIVVQKYDKGGTGPGRPDANIAKGVYYIQNPAGNVKLNSPNGRTVNKANTAGNSAKWEINKVGSYYTIKNLRNNEYLEVPYAACTKGSTTQNPNLNLGTYNSTASNHQRWSITKVGSDFYLQPLHCDKVVDRNGPDPLHLWAYIPNENQHWRIVSANGSGPVRSTIKNRESGGFISSANPSALALVKGAGAKEQFEIVANSDNTVSLKGSNGRYVSSENGASVMTCNRTSVGAWERFTIERVDVVGGVAYYGIKANNNQYLKYDMTTTSTVAGTWQQWAIANYNAVARLAPPVALADIKVYPNPANATLHISGTGPYDVAIYGVLGNLADQKANVSSTMDISSLKPGMYVIHVSGAGFNKSIRFSKQ